MFTAEINGFLIKNLLEMGARNFKERGSFEGIVHFGIVRNGICNLNFLTKKSETNHHVAKVVNIFVMTSSWWLSWL